ncbi:uncharacterized protein [Odocoileus virginianus]|uniref:Uncharacterized protein n=1 Tax=Odocoileus virginianus TaxID=9874 RepID=A0ABM4H775_ODOVR
MTEGAVYVSDVTGGAVCVSDVTEGAVYVGCTGPSLMVGNSCGHVVGGACPCLVGCEVLPPVFAVETPFCWSSVSQWQDPLGRVGVRLAEVFQELGPRRLPGSGMMLPDLSDLWAHLGSTSRLLSAHGCPGDPQGQGAEIAACEVTGTLMHSRQYLKDATPLAAPKNEATLPERWQEAGLEEARLFSRRRPRLRWGASRSPGQSRAAGTRKAPARSRMQMQPAARSALSHGS